MDTATKPTAVTAPAAEVDLRTRMDIAKAGIDAILAHRHGITLAEARAAVTEAEEILPREDGTGRPTNPILAAAGKMIMSVGWIQGTYGNTEVGMCAAGAVRAVARGEGWAAGVPQFIYQSQEERDAIDELLNRIALDLGETTSIPDWNDSRTDVSQVLRLLY